MAVMSGLRPMIRAPFIALGAWMVLASIAGCGLQTRLIFPAKKIDPGHALTLPAGASEVAITTADSVRLSAIHFARYGSEKIVLYFHGNAENLKSWQYGHPIYNAMKTDALVFDYRGYGKSGGAITEAGLYRDGEAVYAFARNLGYADTNIILHGRSIGTGIAVETARGKKMHALILESPYANLRDMIYREYWFMFPRLYLAYSLNSCEKMGEIHAPVFILHGTEDGVIPHRYGQELFNCAQEPKTLISIPGGGHNDLARFAEYAQGLKAALVGKVQ
jgi:uncharacterized protein